MANNTHMVQVVLGSTVQTGHKMGGREILSLSRMRPHPSLGPCRAAKFTAKTKSGFIEMTMFDREYVVIDAPPEENAGG